MGQTDSAGAKRCEGRSLDEVLGRAMRPDKPGPEPRDADEFAANLASRGYAPGQLSDVAGQLADAEAELAVKEDKIERSLRRQERIARDHPGRQDQRL
jgi:hypothetical protein